MRHTTLAPTESAHLLESVLRSVPVEELTAAAASIPMGESDALLRTLFNGASLSPWTDFAEKLLRFVREKHALGQLSTEQRIDFLGWMLRQIGRHLTSYDLVTFHHRGANYPDALLLDLVLKEYLVWIERRPDLFEDHRLRRRALRQGWIVRRRYEGHPVPDLPTSPGENNRVLPPTHPRVPEEQVLQTNSRTRLLYDGDPLTEYLGPHAAKMLQHSLADLRDPAEQRELGVGIFLDRPLGADKAPGEPDGSPLLASVAFSRSIAVQRVHALAREDVLVEMKPTLDECLRSLLESPPRGLPLDRLGGTSRPGVVSLIDARLASPDFEFLWTTADAFRTLRTLFDFEKIDILDGVLLARDPNGSGLCLYDRQQRRRAEIEVDRSRGYVRRGGVEYPVGGLHVRI